MRQLFLVIVLVAAAFLGGAFVNGPGLQWAQTRLLRSLGLNNVGEIASIKLESAADPELESKAPVDSSLSIIPAPGKPQGPTSSVPSVQIDAESPKHVLFNQSTSSQARSKSITNGLASPASSPLPSAAFDKYTALNSSGNPSSTRSDNTVTPTSGRIPQDSTPIVPPLKGDTGPAILDTLAALLPTDSPGSPSPASLPLLTANSKSHMSGTDSWVILERKMQSLGVVHYTVDGEPGGRVMFSCLIPIAGRQAVTERFEAEGEDIIHATQATLRRIALWRATQPTMP